MTVVHIENNNYSLVLNFANDFGQFPHNRDAASGAAA
jgi:hypothetical protein